MKPLPLIGWIYASAVVTSLVYMLSTAHENAFCGLPAVVLTIPWSFLFSAIIQAIFPEIFDSSMIPGTVLILTSALINLLLICRLAGKTK